MERYDLFVELLKNYELSNAIIGEIDSENDVQRRLKTIFAERDESSVKFGTGANYDMIPRFYKPRKMPIIEDRTDNAARLLLADIKKARYVAKLLEAIECFEEGQEAIEGLVLSHSTPQNLDRPNEPPQEKDIGACRLIENARIDFDGILKIGKTPGLHPILAEIFSTELYFKYRRDRWGRISSAMVLNHLRFEIWYRRHRIELAHFDARGDGYLTDTELQNYIRHVVSTSPILSGALSDVLEGQERLFFYLITAAQKFLFFLDPKKTWRIAIADILASPILRELSDAAYGEGDGGSDNNWFSTTNFVRVYNLYLDMDCEKKGMLSRENFHAYKSTYGEKTLTHVFIDRIFSECLTYDGEVDYKTFLEFVLAMENKKDNEVSLTYLFRLLDMNKQGFLDRFTISYFFRSILEQLSFSDDIRVDDVVDEIFDMCKPKNPSRIALRDLIDCGQGHVIVDMLTDVSGFWSYDTRESRTNGDGVAHE